MGVGAEANSDNPGLRFLGGVLHMHLGWGNTPGLGPLQMQQSWHAACDVPWDEVPAIMQTVADIDDGTAAVSAIDMALAQSPGAASAWSAAKSKAGGTCGQTALEQAAYRALRRLLR